MRLRQWVVLVVAVMSIGCMSWRPGWELTVPEVASGDAAELVARADELAARADDERLLRQAIELYEQAVAVDPESLHALSELGQYYCLLGAAYTDGKRDKAAVYRRAIQYCERAMATNPDFRALVDDGASVPEACPVLTERELDALHFWSTAVSYYFKECTSGLGYLVNFKWMKRNTAVMERLREVAPDWQHGAVHFAWGIYYLALPKVAGGDMELSRQALDRAVKVGPGSLLPRWGRAKYYAVKTGDRELFEQDLTWVLAQDPHEADSPYPWNVYFQRDARAMLDEVERHF